MANGETIQEEKICDANNMDTVIPKSVKKNESIILEPLLHGGLCDGGLSGGGLSDVELAGVVVVCCSPGVSLGQLFWFAIHCIICPATY